jgi:hypothetical protein
MKRLSFLFVLFFVCTSVFAQDNGFTESDRQLLIQMDKRLTVLENRAVDMEKSNQLRFEQIQQRFEQVEKSNQQRFELMDKRIDQLMYIMLAMLAGIFGLIGFVAYDRRTAIYPLEKKLMELEQKEIILAKDHEITRKALREEALQNPVLKDILIRLGIF